MKPRLLIALGSPLPKEQLLVQMKEFVRPKRSCDHPTVRPYEGTVMLENKRAYSG
jgi:hypothetical protein